MKSILFLKTKDDQYLFKADTLWSKTKTPSYAKVYQSITNIDELLKASIMPYYIYKDIFHKVVNRYDDAILGYFTPDEDKFDGDYSLKDGVELKKLGKPTYLWVIKMNKYSEWITIEEKENSIRFDTKSMCIFESYTQHKRDKAINDLLK